MTFPVWDCRLLFWRYILTSRASPKAAKPEVEGAVLPQYITIFAELDCHVTDKQYDVTDDLRNDLNSFVNAQASCWEPEDEADGESISVLNIFWQNFWNSTIFPSSNQKIFLLFNNNL